MGNTRDLFKKIRNTKGTFHEKMSTIKDRNGMDLTEVEDIKKRWQEYTEELYKKDLQNPDNHDGVYWSVSPFPPPMDHVLLELFTTTYPALLIASLNCSSHFAMARQ